jgi:hypothetical protein
MKPTPGELLVNEALRMKCWVWVASSQMMMTDWSALTTRLPGGATAQQAEALLDRMRRAVKAEQRKRKAFMGRGRRSHDRLR